MNFFALFVRNELEFLFTRKALARTDHSSNILAGRPLIFFAGCYLVFNSRLPLSHWSAIRAAAKLLFAFCDYAL